MKKVTTFLLSGIAALSFTAAAQAQTTGKPAPQTSKNKVEVNKNATGKTANAEAAKDTAVVAQDTVKKKTRLGRIWDGTTKVGGKIVKTATSPVEDIFKKQDTTTVAPPATEKAPKKQPAKKTVQETKKPTVLETTIKVLGGKK